MLKLPKGYYAVQSDFENASKNTFVFKGVTYEVTDGENLFADVHQAKEHALDIPTTVIDGLSYDSFDAPVILFSAGKHSVEKHTFTKPLIMLGQKAGINPNIFNEDRFEAPLLNPERSCSEEESILIGGYDYGNMILNTFDVDLVMMDGFTFKDVRFRDLRSDGLKTKFVFRNIIEEGPSGKTFFLFSTIKKGVEFDRDILIQNIRIVDLDDYGYGGSFTLVNAGKVVLDGIYYDNTAMIFGFSNLWGCYNNYNRNISKNQYVLKNSYLRNLKGENGVGTCAFDTVDKGIDLTISNCTFVDASRENEAPINPHLANDNCTVTVKNCAFRDTRNNAMAAITVRGKGRAVTIEDSTFEGFAADWSEGPEIPENAPDYIENHNEDWVTKTEDPHTVTAIDKADFAALDALYVDKKAYYGDQHVHTACGGTSDGKYPMKDWPAAMDEKKLDFAMVVDHRQMRGFFLPEWDDTRFVIGTEPGTWILNLNACRNDMNVIHYNMLFPHKYALAMVLANFPEFNFRGDELTGSFEYHPFTKERFMELTKYVQSIGGMMVHPHPATLLCSEDPLDFYFGEHMYLETLYGGFSSHGSAKNYDLWVKLLALGKHVWTSGGSDTHGAVTNSTVSTFYSKEKSGKAFFDVMHSADYTVGAIGLKMCIDGNPMGSELAYKEGMKLTLRADDFFEPMFKKDTAYELRIITDKGVAYASMFNGKMPQAVELKVEKRAFYRAEVVDRTHNYRIAIGNPIWLDKE